MKCLVVGTLIIHHVVALSSPAIKTKDCIVVGGGPVGLATALMLHKKAYNVTVLEQSQGATAVATYDPTKSYLYNVNPRGIEWFQQNTGMDKLQEYGHGLTGFGSICYVPADPEKPIQVPKPVTISGKVKPSNKQATGYRATKWYP